jgi:uncharacterized DUF497 family protein
LLLRARLVPGRAGADTQVIVHVSFSQLRQLPGADEVADEWLRARLGEPGDPGAAYHPDGTMDARSAVVTYREDRIRIISVRRARDEEVRIYEI